MRRLGIVLLVPALVVLAGCSVAVPDPTRSESPTPGPATALELGPRWVRALDADARAVWREGYDGDPDVLRDRLSALLDAEPEITVTTGAPNSDSVSRTVMRWEDLELIVPASGATPGDGRSDYQLRATAARVAGLRVRTPSGLRVGSPETRVARLFPAQSDTTSSIRLVDRWTRVGSAERLTDWVTVEILGEGVSAITATTTSYGV